MRLQLNGPLSEQRQLAVPKVLQAGVIHYQLVVEVDSEPLANHQDAKVVPLADRQIGQDKRIFAGGTRPVVPKATAPLVGAKLPVTAFLGVVPDLHLRRRPEIYTAIALGHNLVIEQQLDVAEVSVCSQVGAGAVVDQLA